MQRIDLRGEVPPLGYRPEAIPVPDLSNFDPERDRFPSPSGKGPAGVFHLQDYPNYVLRQQDLQPEDASSPIQLRDLVAAGNRHFMMLEEFGLHIPAHRHIEATLSSIGEDDGELLTIAERLPSSYEKLNPRNKQHLPGCMIALRTLYTYTKSRLTPANSDILIDIFEAKQHSVDVAAGRIALHDTDIEIRSVREANGAYDQRVRFDMGYFQQFFGQVREAAQGTLFETPLVQLQQRALSELPEPLFDRFR